MHSSQLEEVGFGFSSFVDVENIPNLTDTNEETKQNEKTFDDVKAVLESRKIKEVKFISLEVFRCSYKLMHFPSISAGQVVATGQCLAFYRKNQVAALASSVPKAWQGRGK
jgi:hypothetical protein